MQVLFQYIRPRMSRIGKISVCSLRLQFNTKDEYDYEYVQLNVHSAATLGVPARGRELVTDYVINYHNF